MRLCLPISKVTPCESKRHTLSQHQGVISVAVGARGYAKAGLNLYRWNGVQSRRVAFQNGRSQQRRAAVGTATLVTSQQLRFSIHNYIALPREVHRKNGSEESKREPGKSKRFPAKVSTRPPVPRWRDGPSGQHDCPTVRVNHWTKYRGLRKDDPYAAAIFRVSLMWNTLPGVFAGTIRHLALIFVWSIPVQCFQRVYFLFSARNLKIYVRCKNTYNFQ